MKNKTLKIVLISVLSWLFYVQAMERQEQSLEYLLVIPGQNGQGGEDIKDLDIFPASKYVRIDVETPTWVPDFGQNQCQKYLQEAVKKVPKGAQYTLYGASQGTATAINGFSKLTKKPKMIILESVLASGNSAIFHTVTGPLMKMKCLKKIPGAYHIVPYFAKILFPCYNPGGQQALFCVDSIDTDIPVVIIHATQDPQLSIDDARAVYYRLQEKGNNQSYLMEIPRHEHVNLLCKNDPETAALKTIIQRIEKSSAENGFDERLAPYQPPHQKYEQYYHLLACKERYARTINSIVKMLGASAIILVTAYFVSNRFAVDAL